MRHYHVIGLDRDGETGYYVEMTAVREGPILNQIGVETTWADYAALMAGYPGGPPPLALGLSRLGSVEKRLQLPVLRHADTEKAIHTALEDSLASPPTEVSFGWRRAGNGELQVLAAPGAEVRRILAEAAGAGLTPIRVDLRPYAAATGFWYSYGDTLGNLPALLIELRVDECSLICLRDGEVIMTRALPGLNGGSPDALPGMIEELRLTIALLLEKPGWREPDCLWLTGPLALAPGVREKIATLMDLTLESCRIAAPRNCLRLATVAEPGPESLVPFGFCLAACKIETLGADLLPGINKAKKGFHPALTWAIPLGLAALLTLGGLRLLGEAHPNDTAGSYLSAEGQKRAAELTEVEKDSQNKEKLLRSLTAYGGDGVASLEVFSALDRSLPSGTVIKRISLEHGRVTSLEGTTPSLVSLLRRLRREPLLAALSQSGQTSSKSADEGPGESFILTAPAALAEGGR